MVLPETKPQLVAASEQRQKNGQLRHAPARLLQLPQDASGGRLPPRGGVSLGHRVDQLYDATLGIVAVSTMPVEASLNMRKHVAGGRGVGIQSEERALLKATRGALPVQACTAAFKAHAANVYKTRAVHDTGGC